MSMDLKWNISMMMTYIKLELWSLKTTNGMSINQWNWLKLKLPA